MRPSSAVRLAVAGFAFGLLLGVFALGVFTRRANQWDAMIGAIAGLVVLLIAQFGVPELAKHNYLPPDRKVAFPWFAFIGSTTTFARRPGRIVPPSRSRSRNLTPLRRFANSECASQ